MSTNYWCYAVIGRRFEEYEDMPEAAQGRYDEYTNVYSPGDLVVIHPEYGTPDGYIAGFLLGVSKDFQDDMGLEFEKEWGPGEVADLFLKAIEVFGTPVALIFGLYIG
jgi:hypothetical protein